MRQEHLVGGCAASGYAVGRGVPSVGVGASVGVGVGSAGSECLLVLGSAAESNSPPGSVPARSPGSEHASECPSAQQAQMAWSDSCSSQSA
jgi:hypothetical protein